MSGRIRTRNRRRTREQRMRRAMNTIYRWSFATRRAAADIREAGLKMHQAMMTLPVDPIHTPKRNDRG